MNSKQCKRNLTELKKPLPKIYAAYFDEDWKTKGNWLGRTTINWAIMCAGASPLDHEVLMCKDLSGRIVYWSQRDI